MVAQAVEATEEDTALALVVTFMLPTAQPQAPAPPLSGLWKPPTAQRQACQWSWDEVQYCLLQLGFPASASEPGSLAFWLPTLSLPLTQMPCGPSRRCPYKGQVCMWALLAPDPW